MRFRSERQVVQKPLVRYAIESGWTYLSPDDAKRLRHSETSPILWSVFVGKVQEFNAGSLDKTRAEEIANRFIRVPSNIEGNLQAWEYLKGLKTVFVEAEKRERNLRLLNFEDIQKNSFYVTDEFVFKSGVHTIRADVAFLINGIPIILIETKAATKLEGIAEALDQRGAITARGLSCWL